MENLSIIAVILINFEQIMLNDTTMTRILQQSGVGLNCFMKSTCSDILTLYILTIFLPTTTCLALSSAEAFWEISCSANALC